MSYVITETILNTARGLFDTDDAGNITGVFPTSTPDVHPEYTRAVVELVARLTADFEQDDDAYNTTAALLGLPSHDAIVGSVATA